MVEILGFIQHIAHVAHIRNEVLRLMWQAGAVGKLEGLIGHAGEVR